MNAKQIIRYLAESEIRLSLYCVFSSSSNRLVFLRQFLAQSKQQVASEQVTISIETLLDGNDLTVEKVTGRLRNVEQRKKNAASAVDKQGRLLLTEEECLHA